MGCYFCLSQLLRCTTIFRKQADFNYYYFYNKNHEIFYCILKLQQQWDEWWSSTLLNAFRRNFHQASLFWEFSVLGINSSAEKSFNLLFSSIDHWYNLMTLLCWIMNDRHKENISSFQSSLCFSFLTFPVLLAIWNYKFASQILCSRHFAFQCLCQSRISGHNSPGLLKSLPSLLHYF